MAEKQTQKNLKIGQGKPGPGRKKGVPNKTTRALQEAILLAGENVGSDGAGKGGLTGYCEFLARTEPKAYSSLLGRVLPHTIQGADGSTPKIIWEVTLASQLKKK